jgi:hypothetical protein
MGHCGFQPIALGTSSVAARHIRRQPRFVQKHQLGRIKRWLRLPPGRALLLNVRSLLLGGMRGFF